MEKSKLSPDFTLEDIYKLREYNSLRHINMTTEEIKEDISKGADELTKEIEKIRQLKKKEVVL